MKAETVDYKQLLKATASDRLNLIKTNVAQDLLSQLTPVERAKLFPKYYLDKAYQTTSAPPPSPGLLDRVLTSLRPPMPPDDFYSSKSYKKAPPDTDTIEPTNKATAVPASKEDIKKIDKEPDGRNPLIKQREVFRKELKDNPALKRKLAGLLYKENIGAGPAVIESLFNRISLEGNVKGKQPTIEEYLNRKGKRQFYGPIRRGVDLSINDEQFEKAEAYIDEALDGSNVTEGATDQGSGNDPNVRHKGGKKVINGETFNDFGGFGHNEAEEFRTKQQKEYKEYQNTIEAERIQTGKILPDTSLPTAVPETDNILPENIDPTIRKYYDGLSSFERGRLKKMIDQNGGIDNLEQVIKDHADTVISKAATGRAAIASKAVDNAMSVKGLHERRDRDTIRKYLKDGGVGINPAKVAWCGAMVRSSLEQAGIKGLPADEALVASNWKKWGTGVDAREIAAGDVVVNQLRRDGSGKRIKTGDTGGHVAMATGKVKRDEAGNITEYETIDGNSGDSVKTRWHKIDAPMDIRRAREEDYYEQNLEAEATAPQAPLPADPTAIPEQDNKTGSIEPIFTPLPKLEAPSVDAIEAPNLSAEPDSIPEQPQTPTAVPAPAEPPKTTGKAVGRAAGESPTKITPKIDVKPTQSTPDVPMMKTGGEVQASGEDFSIVDNNSKRKLGEVSRGENIKFNTKGRVEVTPDQRIDPRALEAAQEVRQEHHERVVDNNKQEMPQATMMQGARVPEKAPTQFTSYEQWGHTETPASYVRAMAQAKGRKHDGSFPGSRFGEEQLSAL